MKKAIRVVLFVVTALIIGCVFLLRSEWGQTFLWKNVNQTQDTLVDCFAEAPVKCGAVNRSDEEIAKEIQLLRLTNQEARELILNAQKDEIEKFNELTSKRSLTEDEEWRLDVSKKSQDYYIRVLKVIDRME